VRGTTRIPRWSHSAGTELTLDGFYGLNPAFAYRSMRSAPMPSSRRCRAISEPPSAALVAADAAGKDPFALRETADFVYVRLHGSAELYRSRYTDAELRIWARRIRRPSATRRRTRCAS
jgi:hypothetical protein